MKDFLQRIEKLTPKQLSLLACELQSRLEALQRQRAEAIAIVGIGCRLPGGIDSPESFWQVLSEGRDAISEVPAERWDVTSFYDPDPDAVGKVSSRWGGFCDDVDKFDAKFFGLSNREATSMDPQQRLLLETSWEALERAGIPPKSLAGRRLGIFFGLSTADYYQLLLQRGAGQIDGYTATGTAHSVAAGRLAYILGTHGPTMTIDTACSSSLVAVHLAAQSLRANECEVALAGGANVLVSPETTIALSKARMMAPDGRCKTFDDSADGFVRAEGCGVVALKLLSRAVEDRDPILGVIRGSAVNQDGRSSGLTAPNGTAQESVIRQALEQAGLKGSDIQYVESHGTGTSLGDPIEAHALAAVLGTGRNREKPFYVGSVKTNLGHLEAAAGVTGLIKAVLSLQKRTIPANLHFTRLNRHIELNGAPLIVPTHAVPWPEGDRRLAGVSSFGFSGSNAHVIVEAAPERTVLPEGSGVPREFTISARTPNAVRKLAARYEEFLHVNPSVSLRDFCYTARAGRSALECSTAIRASSLEELRERLQGIANGADEFPPGLAPTADPEPGSSKIAIPTYPFERQRYWVDAPASAPVLAEAAPGFYEVEWQPKERIQVAAASKVPVVAQIVTAVAPQFLPLNRQHKLDRYPQLAPVLDRLSFQYIVRALQALGWKPKPGETFRSEELAARLGVQERYGRSFARFLEIVSQEGLLETTESGWKTLRDLSASDLDVRADGLEQQFPQFKGEVTFLRRCGEGLARVLSGQADPLQLLFPNGSFETAEELYEKSAGARVFQTLVQQTVSRAIEQFPETSKIRILEIGAGTGGTASYVAPALPANRTEYTFSDVSPLFAARAAKKFRDYPFFRFEVLDIESSPESQGFGRHQFDLVIAANSLHATVDLRQTMTHVRELLAPGGILVLLEGTRSERWVDVSFGLTDGWWRFTDRDLRPSYPLLSRDGWEQLLRETGFEDVTGIPDDRASQQAILVARGTESAADKKRWVVVASNADTLGPALATTLGARLAHAESEVRDIQTLAGIVDLRASCEGLAGLVRQLPAQGNPPRVWAVTRGAQPVRSAVDSRGVEESPVWGLGRTIALEEPIVWGGLVDLDPEMPVEEQAAMLRAELLGSDGEDQLAFRRSVRYVGRLRSVVPPETSAIQFDAEACYLITGGLGGLGLVVARWMVQSGARRLILVSRTGLTRDSQRTAVQGIEQLGARVRVMTADISDPGQTSRLFNQIRSEEPVLKGVVHAAAELRRDTAREMNGEALRAATAAKIAGTRLIHEHTKDLPLDFLVLFSSTAAVLGSSGLGHYAAANQFLDAFASYRRGLGLPALSVNWGTWDQMRTVSEVGRKQYRSVGFLPMRSDAALNAIGSLLGSSKASAMVAAVDWRVLKATFEARRKRPLLEQIEASEATSNKPVPTVNTDSEWIGMTDAQRVTRLCAIVWEQTRHVLGIDPDEPVDLDRGFFEMGMDSLVSVDLKRRLETALGRSLPGMLTFDYPTVRSLAARLAADYAVPSTVEPEEPQGLDGDLTDQEVADLLAKKLEGLEQQGGILTSK